VIKLITKHIPNFLTCLNLLCGCLALILIFNNEFITAAYFVFAAGIIDFLDGFAARLLNAYSPIGKDLDSLADMVTFGVVPGMMLFQLTIGNGVEVELANILPYFSILIPVFSALRLAKFNNDKRQSESFIGLPTPANAFLICSLPFIIEPCLHDVTGNCTNQFDCYVQSIFTNQWLFILFCCLMSFLLVAELPLFSLKFKSYGWKGNQIRFVFLGVSLIILILLKFSAIPLIIFLYILLSVVNNVMRGKEQPLEK
jgi:CDP-diacylglycerol---serine O-phosphatidyltransferase